ncbi:IpaC/SipC family type III secretion system effector [Pandoraea sputorum]|uniref:Effector protein BipC n=1 Tax=Pandoraea sputorum TaxID=93222 RepID=A0A5E5AM22_9BURK|nr:IpaC/SipC family type III secretion system effector [Pandoraea sputorum]VVE74126.1 Invasin IpaC [Pandoraea sputorum]
MSLPIQDVTYQPFVPMLDTLDKPQSPSSVLNPSLLFTPDLDDEDAQRPSLANPPPHANRLGAIDWLREQDDKKRIGVDTPAKDGDKDIGSNGLVSDAALVLSLVYTFYVRAYENSVKLRNRMAEVNVDSVLAAADATRRQGDAAMWGGISSGAVQLAFTGMGAFQSLKGLSGERTALKTPTSTPDVTPPPPPPSSPDVPSATNASTAAAGQSPASRRNSMDANVLDDAPPPPRPDALDSVDVPDAPPSATNTDAASAPDTLNQEAMADNGRRAQTSGQALMMLGSPLAGVTNGASRYSELIAAQDQKVNDSGAQLSKDGVNTLQEQSNRDNSTLTEMLRAFDSVSQASIGSVSTIANNLRA